MPSASGHSLWVSLDCRGNGTETAKHKVTYDGGVKSRMELNRQLKHLTGTRKAKGSPASQEWQVVFGELLAKQWKMGVQWQREKD